MKLNLRQAHTIQAELQKSIISEIQNISQDLIRHDEFSNIKKVMAEKNNEQMQLVKKVDSMIKVLYSLRLKIKMANVEFGVERVISELSCVKDMMNFYSSQAKLTPRTDPEILSEKADKIKNSVEPNYTGSSLISGIFSKDQLDCFQGEARAFKREMRKLNDTLTELNITNHIELNQMEIDVLEDLDLI